MVKSKKREYRGNYIFFNILHILFTTFHLSPTLALISNRALLAPVFVCAREGVVKGEESGEITVADHNDVREVR